MVQVVLQMKTLKYGQASDLETNAFTSFQKGEPVPKFEFSSKMPSNTQKYESQCHFLCVILEKISTINEEGSDQLVCFVAGVAGGGKSYVQDIAADLLKTCTANRYGV